MGFFRPVSGNKLREHRRNETEEPDEGNIAKDTEKYRKEWSADVKTIRNNTLPKST
jgi:hypothetical protein